MKYINANKYSRYSDSFMGPNPVKLLEEILTIHPIEPQKTVLDLGCGQGITSIYLVKECKATVIAADLWIDPTQNKIRFDGENLTPCQIIPLNVEAHSLPFADEFFDYVVSIDSYHYFGLDKDYLGTHLLPKVKKGGYILIVVPGFKKDIHDNIPQEMLLSWTAENLTTIHDKEYWLNIISQNNDVEICSMSELANFDECWQDWLNISNEYAVNDKKAFDAGAGKYMNLLAFVLRKK